MSLKPEKLEELIFGAERSRRFTQDSPVMPDVWIAYGLDPGSRHDLLLTPHTTASAAELGHYVQQRLGGARAAYNESYVVAELDWEELVTVLLPLTQWWREHVWRPKGEVSDVEKLHDESVQERLVDRLARQEVLGYRGGLSPDLIWLMRVVGRIEIERRSRGRRKTDPKPEQLISAADPLIEAAAAGEAPDKAMLWRVDRNRVAANAISRSILAVKADAAVRLFELDCQDLRWAVVDSGIDARHPAFRKRDRSALMEPLYEEPFEGGENRTRIIATYDFTRLRELLTPGADPSATGKDKLTREERARWDDLKRALRSGRTIDWQALEPLLRIPHEPGKYIPPKNEHGTHVAGILTADWKPTDDGMPVDENMVGIAKGLELYDLRVLDQEGRGDEFSLIGALQFVRWLNGNKDRVLVHGVNISLSIRHDVANYACGRTPVCEECERLVGAGTVVVAAAGNDGFARYETAYGDPSDGYRSISITDPGNAEGVITVGATHRFRPHSYGVSYFSSRGPTGDGRLKPDLVAPGEKIMAPTPDGRLKTMDGTSMAAPHVSAAAALLMARYYELIGDPVRIKQVLCQNATDLGRERYFQGHGMLDVLRALQAV
jgi:serine protease AprX